MAALQHTPISLQSPPSARIPRTSIHNLSFSTAFPSLRTKLKLAVATGNGRARMASAASSSYAVALVDLANSNNTLEKTYEDVEKIEKIFSEKQVFDFFINPTIDAEKKRQMLDEISSSSSLQRHTNNFLNILVEARRIDLINEIVKEYEIVYNKLTNTEMAVVSSVVQLETQHLTQIAKQVQKLTGAKNVRVKTLIDPNLVAGFTVRYGSTGSKFIDLSVKKQLEEIATQLDLGDIAVGI
ncbi:hypothetical protein I3843_12G043000 [Carya illinoinensis]|uniref:Uncharacterized protein n=1 Tax=Carya illinoinensis TaxID=32201 RepID=A0A8T1NMU6_CARIL|nr:ATP synthase subunit delta, chloroplastic-like [Carya illinoinensis]KAG6633356.1 hypothetical protein CIPAW_12G043000 [Carya illinoinensis]KAG7952117.1 hypothetical protein I3843_12G043000 [Carya illinoinensis]